MGTIQIDNQIDTVRVALRNDPTVKIIGEHTYTYPSMPGTKPVTNIVIAPDKPTWQIDKLAERLDMIAKVLRPDASDTFRVYHDGISFAPGALTFNRGDVVVSVRMYPNQPVARQALDSFDVSKPMSPKKRGLLLRVEIPFRYRMPRMLRNIA